MSRTPPLLRRLCLSTLGLAALLAATLLACTLAPSPAQAPAWAPVAAAMRQSGVPALPLAALLLAAGPMLASLFVARARPHPSLPPHPVPAGATARRSALLLVLPFALAGLGLAGWVLRLAPDPAAAAAMPIGLAVAAAVLAFPILVGERMLATADPAALPEAPALRRLALVAVLAAFATGLVAVVAALGLAAAPVARRALAVPVLLVGAELSLRAVGRRFLPPGPPADARAVVESLAARLLASLTRLEAGGAGSAAALLRDQLGIDVSRSWALGFLRAATLPLGLVLLLCAWGLSGLAVVPIDGRAVYLRLGAPVAVLRPGLHAILPWPLGRVRPLDGGVLHELALGELSSGPAARTGAEDADPTEADRLWDQPHPGELTLLVASTAAHGVEPVAGERQLFQSVAADIRVLYRIGLDDRSAIRATTGVLDPARLLRADADQVVGSAFAGRTLAQVLGADRERLAATLRDRLQRLLDRQQVGLEAVALVVEAIHPPAGAAEAYHAVRAAEISADAQVYAERGRAATVRAQTRQYAFGQAAAATARAAETAGEARSLLTRFSADADAHRRDGPSFLLERRLADLAATLGRTPTTIIDARLDAPGATTLDLRPMPGTAPTTGDGE